MFMTLCEDSTFGSCMIGSRKARDGTAPLFFMRHKDLASRRKLRDDIGELGKYIRGVWLQVGLLRSRGFPRWAPMMWGNSELKEGGHQGKCIGGRGHIPCRVAS